MKANNKIINILCLVVALYLTAVPLFALAVTTEMGREAVTVGATVPEISPGTTTPVFEVNQGGGFFIPKAPATTPGEIENPEEAYITIRPHPGSFETMPIAGGPGLPVREGTRFLGNYPELEGETNVDGGLIIIDIAGPTSFRSSVMTRGDSTWHWRSPEKLKPGYYSLQARVYDPLDFKRTNSANLEFIIGTLAKPETFPQPGAAGSLILLVKVPDRYKTVNGGQRLVVAVRLSFLPPKKGQVDLEYVVSRNHQQLAETKETVNLDGSTEFLKTFYINPEAAVGEYEVTVRARYGGRLHAASDTFIVQSRGAIATAPNTLLNLTLWFEAFLAVLLILALLAYFEYNKTMFGGKRKKETDENQNQK